MPRRRRPPRLGPLFGSASVGFVLLLVVVPTSIATGPSASSPIRRFAAPFTNGSLINNVSTVNTGCGGNYTLVHRPWFNIFRGYARYGKYVNVSSGCGKPASATYTVELGVSNLTFLVPFTGWFNVRAIWLNSVRFDFTYNYYPDRAGVSTEIVLGDTLIVTDLGTGHTWTSSKIAASDKTGYGCYFCYYSGYQAVPEVGRIHLFVSHHYSVTTFAWITVGVALPANSGRAFVQSAEARFDPGAVGGMGTVLRVIVAS